MSGPVSLAAAAMQAWFECRPLSECVDDGVVCGRVYVDEGGVDGASSARLAGLGVSEFDVLRGVGGWKCDCACCSCEGEGPVGMDLLDGPVVSLDHRSMVGLDETAIEAGYDFVSLIRCLTAGL